jgi:hypothetical protein
MKTDLLTSPLLSVPAPTPAHASSCAAVVPMSATASYDRTSVSGAGHSAARTVLPVSFLPAIGLGGDDATGLPARAAPV